MSKKPRKIIDNTALFAQQEAPKQARLDELERNNALLKAGEIYNQWQKRVVMQSRKIEELPELINLLAWELERGVPHEDLRKNILNLVHQKLADVFTRIELEKNIVRVFADCPAIVGNPEFKRHGHADPTIECGWGGEAAFHKAMWEAGQVKFECPQCKSVLTKEDMILASEVKVEKPNRVVRLTPRFARTGNVLDKDVYTFLSTPQLLNFRFMQDFSEKEGFERFALEGRNIFAIVKGENVRVAHVEFPEAVNIEPLHPLTRTKSAPPSPAAETGSATPEAPAIPAQPAANVPSPANPTSAPAE